MDYKIECTTCGKLTPISVNGDFEFHKWFEDYTGLVKIQCHNCGKYSYEQMREGKRFKELSPLEQRLIEEGACSIALPQAEKSGKTEVLSEGLPDITSTGVAVRLYIGEKLIDYTKILNTKISYMCASQSIEIILLNCDGDFTYLIDRMHYEKGVRDRYEAIPDYPFFFSPTVFDLQTKLISEPKRAFSLNHGINSYKFVYPTVFVSGTNINLLHVASQNECFRC